MANPIMDCRWYARISGIALAATALLGIVMNVATQDGALVQGFLEFDWTHNIVHVVLAAVGLYVGYMGTGNVTRLYARVFGIVYLALGVLGFIDNELFGIGTTLNLGIELGENLVHTALGLWGVVAGFFGTTTERTSTPMAKTA